MNKRTADYKGKRYVIATDFINMTNNNIEELVALYNASKLSMKKLVKAGIPMVDGRDENQKPVKAIAVDDIKVLIQNELEKKVSSKICITKHKNIAAAMNRALCELDADAENLFAPTEEATKTFFRDTDEYTTVGKHSNAALHLAEEKKEEYSLADYVAKYEENEQRKFEAKQKAKKAEQQIIAARKRKEKAEMLILQISKENMDVIKKAGLLLKDMMAKEEEETNLYAA